VDADLRRIRGDGFNTIMIVLPWTDVQPSVDPASYDQELLQKLGYLLEMAAVQGLYVAGRVGYTHNRNVANAPFSPWQLSHFERCTLLMQGHSTLRDAWKGFLGRLDAVLKRWVEGRFTEDPLGEECIAGREWRRWPIPGPPPTPPLAAPPAGATPGLLRAPLRIYKGGRGWQRLASPGARAWLRRLGWRWRPAPQQGCPAPCAGTPPPTCTRSCPGRTLPAWTGCGRG
jgi:hypothetical protein